MALSHPLTLPSEFVSYNIAFQAKNVPVGLFRLPQNHDSLLPNWHSILTNQSVDKKKNKSEIIFSLKKSEFILDDILRFKINSATNKISFLLKLFKIFCQFFWPIFFVVSHTISRGKEVSTNMCSVDR